MPIGRPTLQRFLDLVDIQDRHWLWLGKPTNKGYGQFWDNGPVLAHIWSYKHFVGPVPKEHVLHHICEIGLCVRPECLTTKTRSIHSYDHRIVAPSILMGLNSNKTNCPQGHPYDRENTGYGTRGAKAGVYRYCKICHRDKALAAYHGGVCS